MLAELGAVTLRRDAPVLRPLDLGREIARGTEAIRAGERVRDPAQRQRLRRDDLADAVGRVLVQLAERRGVERARATPGAPSAASRERSSPAALSVNVTARISSARNAPVVTWFAMRCVIVVVLPEPAPARMHTGPRTASTARRCSEFSSTRSLGPRIGRDRYRKRARRCDSCTVELQRRSSWTCARADALRLAEHRVIRRDELERLALLDEPLQLAQLARRATRDRSAPARRRGSSDATVGSADSSSFQSNSCSFSPGRTPVMRIAMSRSGTLPERRIMFSASS